MQFELLGIIVDRMLRKISCFPVGSAIAVAACLVIFSACGKRNPEERAMSPEDSMKAMHVQGDFHVELFASEPNVMSPVDMAFDESGKVYVAEMLDYPDDPPPGKPVRSRIRLLEDTESRRQVRSIHRLCGSRPGGQRNYAVETRSYCYECAGHFYLWKIRMATAKPTSEEFYTPASLRRTKKHALLILASALTTGFTVRTRATAD